jgi:hypothetical protein
MRPLMSGGVDDARIRRPGLQQSPASCFDSGQVRALAHRHGQHGPAFHLHPSLVFPNRLKDRHGPQTLTN